MIPGTVSLKTGLADWPWQIRQVSVLAKASEREPKTVPPFNSMCACAGVQLGLAGDVRPVGEGVSELRIDYGPGYRVYFVQRGRELVILLAGGDKRTQDRDIKTAIELARNL